MSAATEWLQRAEWSNRTARFGELHLVRRPDERAIVSMQYLEPVQNVMPFWKAWQSLPVNAALLRVLEPGVLRYAAIDWRFARLDPGNDCVRVARYGGELCDLLQAVQGHLGTELSTWFVRPIVKVDLEGMLRVAFTPPSYSERMQDGALVVAVGRGLEQLITVATDLVKLGRVIRRCLDVSRVDAIQSLEELRAVLHEIAPGLPISGSRSPFEAIEQGIGAYMHHKPLLARLWMEHAVMLSPSPIARDLLAIVKRRRGRIDPELASTSVSVTAIDPLSTSTIPEVPVPRVFENAHEMLQPIQIRERRIVPAVFTGTPDQQVDEALRRRRYREALDQIDVRLATAPDEPRAHHLRGKALLALGRLPDARAAFDRACTLRPQLLEAMLLRREVDRVMAATQAAAGIANPMALSLPDHLADLRDVLVSGRIVDAIQLLRRPAYDDDAVAQLLLAELLCTDDRHDDALVIYDRVATDEARLGKARALLSLHRPADALDALATATADEAYELRARALHLLGRTDEAGVQMSTYLRLIEQRSDRRIGSK